MARLIYYTKISFWLIGITPDMLILDLPNVKVVARHFQARSQNLRKVTTSFVMSVCLSVRPSAWNNSPPIGRVFMKFDI
jgi:hypothetical protein